MKMNNPHWLRHPLEETLDALRKAHKYTNDIVYLGLPYDEKSCSWSRFRTACLKNYKEGCVMNPELVIVFKDGSYLRREYDQEWDYSYWEYVVPPQIPHLCYELEADDIIYSYDEDDEDE